MGRVLAVLLHSRQQIEGFGHLEILKGEVHIFIQVFRISVKLGQNAAINVAILYRKLDEEKERLYQKYGEVKKELADYGIIKQNVDSILRVTPHQERTQEL